MSKMEIKELSERAAAMSKEERMIVLKSFPLEDLIETIYLGYETMKINYDNIRSIVNNGMEV